ncbi:putative phosphoenolpyruvate synthase [Caerostris extrusa]|uniref:Phosphoenolpyruvate synthase n=1 Tax=Caerostris extrusa TaxID=172846 RepID=A0AAV4URE1_CAEEX|nr:putative phosphoenolpyruvate synthase [Caerostris extrusa]
MEKRIVWQKPWRASNYQMKTAKHSFVVICRCIISLNEKMEDILLRHVKVLDAFNFYAQTGVATGTVSVEDTFEYEMYLFGEKIRDLGKRVNATSCKSMTLLGQTPAIGLGFHLVNISAPYAFKNLSLGFAVDSEGQSELLKEVHFDIKQLTRENFQRTFKISFNGAEAKERYVFVEELKGTKKQEELAPEVTKPRWSMVKHIAAFL